jgi:hypothetical protein
VALREPERQCPEIGQATSIWPDRKDPEITQLAIYLATIPMDGL